MKVLLNINSNYSQICILYDFYCKGIVIQIIQKAKNDFVKMGYGVNRLIGVS